MFCIGTRCPLPSKLVKFRQPFLVGKNWRVAQRVVNALQIDAIRPLRGYPPLRLSETFESLLLFRTPPRVGTVARLFELLGGFSLSFFTFLFHEIFYRF